MSGSYMKSLSRLCVLRANASVRRIVLLLVIDPPRSDVNINIPWAGVQLGIVHVDAPGNVPILTGLHMDCPRVAFVRNVAAGRSLRGCILVRTPACVVIAGSDDPATRFYDVARRSAQRRRRSLVDGQQAGQGKRAEG